MLDFQNSQIPLLKGQITIHQAPSFFEMSMITLLSSMRLSLISIQQCCLPLSVQLTIAIRYMHLQLSENVILTCIYSQATKQNLKLNGVEIYVGLFSMTNERGELRICDLVATKTHSQIEQHLMQLNRSLSLYGHSQPQIIFTDNMADKPLLQTVSQSSQRTSFLLKSIPTFHPCFFLMTVMSLNMTLQAGLIKPFGASWTMLMKIQYWSGP